MRPAPAQLELPGLDGHPVLVLALRIVRRSAIALLLLALGWSAASWRYAARDRAELQADLRDSDRRLEKALIEGAESRSDLALYERWLSTATNRKAIGGPR